MVEKTKTRVREPGPENNMYEVHLKARRDFIQRQNVGKLLIKGNERPWEVCRQGETTNF